MAKKQPNVVKDDLSFDDFDDFDFDIPDPSIKDDRKPIDRVKDGIKEGVVSRAKDPQFMKETMKHVFPRSFGQAVDLGDEVAETAKNLYDESVAEIKPTLKMARKTISKIVPPESDLVPKFLKTKLEKWRQEEDEPQGVSKEQAREGMLSATLKDIFETQQEVDKVRMADQVGRDNLKIGLETTQSRRQLDALNRVAISLKRLDDYNTTIGLNYQKKALELQYRQLFTLQDSLDFQRTDVIRRDQFLASIAKNTALPEFVKLNNKEVGQEIRRRKKYEIINNALFGSTDNFLRNTMQRLSKTFMDSTKTVMQDLRDGMDMAGMAGDMANSGMMGDPASMAGQAIGGKMLDTGAGWAFKKLFGKFQGSEMDQALGVSDKFHKLGGVMGNIPQKLNEFRESRKWDFDNSWKGSLLNMLQGLVPSQKADESLSPTTSKNLFEATSFTVQTARSINEVIPGYLARILREVQIFRTGKEVSLTSFSHDQGAFSDDGMVIKEADAKIIPTRNVIDTRTRLDDMIETIDPNARLSEEERKVLKKHLLKNSIDNYEAKPERLATAEAFQRREPSVNMNAATNVAARMEAFFKEMTEEQKTDFLEKHNRLKSDMFDPRQQMQDMLESGQIEHLRTLKLIKEEGAGPIKSTKIDIDEIIRRYLEDQLPPGSGAAGGVGNGGPGGPGSVPPSPFARGTMKFALNVQKAGSQAKAKAAQAYQSGVSFVNGITPQPIKTAATKMTDQVTNAAKQVPSQALAAAAQVRDKAAPYAAQMKSYGSAAITGLKGFKFQPGLPVLSEDQQAAVREAANAVAEKTKSLSSQALTLVPPETLKAATEGVAKLTNAANEQLAPAMKFVSDNALRARQQLDAMQTQQASTLGMINMHVSELIGKAPKSLAEAQAMLPTVEEAKEAAGKVATRGKRQAKVAVHKGRKVVKKARTKAEELTQQAQEHAEPVMHKVTPAMQKLREELMPQMGSTMREQAQQAAGALKAQIDKASEELRGQLQEAKSLMQDKFGKKPASSISFAQHTLGAAVRPMATTAADIKDRVSGQTLLGMVEPSRAAKAAMDQQDAPGQMLHKGDDFFDVYVEGESTPRLLAEVLRGGRYFLKETKQSIRSMGEIKGAVVNQFGEVVILPQELNKLQYFSADRNAWMKLHKQPLTPLGAVQELGNQLGKMFKSGGMSIINTIQDRLKKDTPSDVYVEGESDPRLYAVKMAQGHYVDAETGDEIKTPKDIKGAVRDAKDGTIVVPAEDVPKLQIFKVGINKRSPLGVILRAGAALGRGAWNWEKLMWKWTKWNFRQLGKLTGAAGRMIGRFMGLKIQAPPRDVFVAGEDTPRLTTAGFKKGEYFDRASMRNLTHESQITGPVVDKNGNTLLDEEDLKNVVVFKKEIGRFSPLGIVRSILASPFKAAKFLAKKAVAGIKGVAKVLAPSYAKYGKALGQGAMDVAGTVGKGALSLLGVRKKAYTLDGKEVEMKQEATSRYKALDKLRSGGGLLVGKFKSLFGAKPNLNQLASLPIGDAAAVKTSVTLGEIAAMVKTISSPKKKALPGQGFADDDARLKADKEKTDKLRQDLFDKLNKKKEGGKEGSEKEEGGMLSSLLDKFGLTDLLGKGKGLMGRGAGLLKGPAGKLLGKAAIPLMAGAAAYGGIGDEASGKKVENAGDVIPEGFWNKLNPFAYAMNAGRFGGNLMNKQYEWASKLFGGSGSMGSDAFGLLHKDPMKQMEEEEKERKKKKDKEKAEAKTPADLKKEEDEKKAKEDGFFAKLGKSLPFSSAQAAPIPGAGAQGKVAVPPVTSPTSGQPYPAAGKAAAGPDAEAAPPSTGGDDSDKPQGAAPRALPKADGDLADGVNAMQYLAPKDSKVKLDGLNPAMQKNLFAMVEEYGSKTGKKVGVNDGFRSTEEQAALFQKFGPSKAARPGTSMHEFGLAVDINTKNANEMERMGLMRKYGFTRPVGGETWHVEPIGTQTDLSKFKKDPQSASDAILAGVGKGGGGLGLDSSVRMGSRDPKNSLAILQAGDDKPQEGMQIASKGLDLNAPAANDANNVKTEYGASVQTGSGGALKTANAKPFSVRSARNPLAANDAMGPDAEAKPPAVAIKQTPRLNPYLRNSIAGENKLAGGPADPTAKVPDPQGPGPQGMMPTIEGASKLVGVDKNTLASVIAMESGFNPNARAGTSSAKGLGQFVDGTWRAMMDKYARKYGLDPSTPPTDAKAAAIMTAQYIKDNSEAIQKKTGMPAGPTEAYMGHFLGTGGAGQFLKTLKDNPGVIAAEAMPKAASANQSIFYEGRRPRTVDEVYALLDKRMRDKAKAFGIDAPSGTVVAKAATPSTAETVSPDAGVETAQVAKAPGSLQTPGMVQTSYVQQPATRASPLATMAGAPTPGMPVAANDAPVRAPAPAPAPAMIGGMDSSAFADAKDILAKSLGVQSEMRDLLAQLVNQSFPNLHDGLQKTMDAMGSSKPEDGQTAKADAPSTGSSPRSPAKPYEVPSAAVSMKRRAA